MPNPYSTPQKRNKLAARDAANVRAGARVVIIVDDDGTPLSVERRTEPLLGVLAVLGVRSIAGEPPRETVLAEVGFTRGRPFHPSLKRNAGGRRFTTKRRLYAQLSDSQLARLFPYIADELAQHTKSVINGWTTKEPWVVPASYIRYAARSGALFSSQYMYITKGVRFSFSTKTPKLSGMILRSIAANENIQGHKRFASKCLSRYKFSWYGEKVIRRIARAKGGIGALVYSLQEKNAGVLYMALLHSLLPKMQQPLFEHIVEICFGVTVEDLRPWAEILHSGEVIARIPGHTLWLPPRGNGKGKDYFVVELIPKVNGTA